MLQGRINITFPHWKGKFSHRDSVLASNIADKSGCWQNSRGVLCMQAEKDHSGREFSPFTPRRSLHPPRSLSSCRPRRPRCRCPRPCCRPYPLDLRRPRHHQPKFGIIVRECKIFGLEIFDRIFGEPPCGFFTSAFSSSAFLILAASSSSSVAVTTWATKHQYSSTKYE